MPCPYKRNGCGLYLEPARKMAKRIRMTPARRRRERKIFRQLVRDGLRKLAEAQKRFKQMELEKT